MIKTNCQLTLTTQSNNIVTSTTEDNTNEVNKVPSEEYENTINETQTHMVFWQKNLFCLPLNSTGKQFVDELTKLIDCWVSDSPSNTTALKS